MMKTGRKILSTLLAAAMVFGITACGSEEVNSSANIELLDPVGTAMNYDPVSYRNIYNDKVYAAYICPPVQEYAFSSDQNFSAYAALPGESVTVGKELILGDTKDVEEQIKEKQKKIDEDEKNYLEKLTENQERYAKAKADEEYWREVMERWALEKPAESDPAYGAWAEENHKYEAQHSNFLSAKNKAESTLKQQKELYELDHNYALYELKLLKEKRADSVISTTVDGDVVAMGIFDLDRNNRMEKNVSVVGIGDMGKKELRCEYISKFDINGSEDVYAFVNGKRYEVDYVPMESEEYTKLTKNGGKAYSTFWFKEDAPEISIGDYAVIVLVKSKRDNVLSICKTSIHKDGSTSYVYLLEGSESIYTPIKTGATDNLYVEVLSGLKEGDKVLADSLEVYKEETVKTTKGSVSYSFKGNGYMSYPESVLVQNPVKYGTVYLEEYKVSQYERVEKGQVLCTVRVTPDTVNLQRNENRLKRVKDRLEDYKKGFKDNPAGLQDKNVVKYIESQNKEIEELEKTIKEMKADFATTEIKATATGVLIWTAQYYYQKNDLVYKDDYLFQIADETSNYIGIEDKTHVLNYGNEVTIKYRDKNGKNAETTGTIATVNQMAVTSGLASNTVLVKINPEALSDMAASAQGYEGSWNRNRFEVSANVRNMDNVVLVPKTAVRVSGDQTFVDVKKKDGSVVTTGFIAGGSDSANYWVIDGLTEGMELCLR